MHKKETGVQPSMRIEVAPVRGCMGLVGRFDWAGVGVGDLGLSAGGVDQDRSVVAPERGVGGAGPWGCLHGVLQLGRGG